uniref:Protein mono-ADP-ribosyltransferase PARP9 n=1 Tax=Oncorhynchus kisutch TaxID=8019 RepID=A0A8C7I769_ONCKI
CSYSAIIASKIPQLTSLNIPLEEEMVSILGQCGSALTNVLQSKFGCTTVLHGVDATCAGQSRKPSVFPEERFSTHLSKSFKVSVWKDDLTTHRVDAVVNAANNRLKHCGGLTKALSDAGGPAIQQDIDQYIFRQGKLSIGDAIIAPPGYLPCRNIIHAVGPNLPYNNRKYEVDNVTPQLQRAVLSILKVVKQDNLQSVAIPAVSSGLFNYPLPLCADVIVKTLKEYHDSNYSGAPLEVRLVNHDDQPVEAQGQPPKASYSQAARSHGKGSTKPFSTPTVQLGNVSLTIKKGYIEREVHILFHATVFLSTFELTYAFMSLNLQGFGHTTDHYESRATNKRRYPRGGASPYIELSSAHNDILREAKCWLTYAFMMPSENFTILNGFIQHFGQREFDKLVCAICDIYRMITDQIWLNLMLQVEKVENSTLKHLFEIKKRQLYQRLPVQYCDLVSRVGFQREFAPPDGREATYSLEIELHFLITRRLADEEYLYFFAAQVQTGKSTIGTPGLIVPPETPGGDPLILYDSVEGGVDTCVIFNGHQALPEYLIICTKKTSTHKF